MRIPSTAEQLFVCLSLPNSDRSFIGKDNFSLRPIGNFVFAWSFSLIFLFFAHDSIDFVY